MTRSYKEARQNQLTLIVKYIESLELKVAALTHTVHVLTEENQFWKSLGLVRGDATCPLAACEAFSPE